MSFMAITRSETTWDAEGDERATVGDLRQFLAMVVATAPPDADPEKAVVHVRVDIKARVKRVEIRYPKGTYE